MTLPPLAILAGGLATRLRPITETIPKSLVEVAGQPFLAHQLRLAKRQGFNKIILLTGHLGEQIEGFAGDGTQFGLDIVYSHDGKEPCGTGGAVRAARKYLDEVTFVTYGDSYLDTAVDPVWSTFCALGAPALMTVLHNHDRWDPSNVIFDGKMVRLHDKMAQGQPGVEWIDYGLSVFRTDVITSCEYPDPFDLSFLTKTLAQKGLLAGHEVSTRFYEIGKPEGLNETEAYLAAK